MKNTYYLVLGEGCDGFEQFGVEGTFGDYAVGGEFYEGGDLRFELLDELLVGVL
jgi:hypothetical protein